MLIFGQVNPVPEKVTASGSGRIAPAPPPKVTQIDIEGLRTLIKPNGKPLLINFWATWCDPCREEFPDLVKLYGIYRGKVDFITVSIDDLAEINTTVPKFLGEMKASMPAFLLKTPDDDAAMKVVSLEWKGNLPLTIIYAPTGETAYLKNGKFRYETLAAAIDKSLGILPADTTIYALVDFVKIKDGKRDEALYFYKNNWTVYRDEALKRGVIASYELIDAKSETNTGFDLMLITRYSGETQYKDSEKNFEPILKALRPNGPMLKNALKPDEFRQNVFLYRGTVEPAPLK